MPLTSVDIQTLSAIYENVRALFLDIYNSTPPAYQDFAMEVQSQNQTEIHNWLGAIPSVKEWVSERTIERLSAFEYAVTNRDWEMTIEIPRNAIEDDRVGLYRPIIETMARQARNHPATLAMQIFQNNPTGYDNQPLFSTTHQEGQSGVQSNIVTGSGTTLAQIIDDLDKVSARFASFKDDRGNPIMIAGQPLDVTHVMVPPGLKGAFETIARAEMIQNTTNKWQGRLQVITNPYLTDQNDWIALCLAHPFKPVLVQIRRPATIQDFNSEAAAVELFHRKRFLIGVDGRYAVAPAFWQTAIRVTNT
jgi:phage major head subunit gpT-like protein